MCHKQFGRFADGCATLPRACRHRRGRPVCFVGKVHVLCWLKPLVNIQKLLKMAIEIVDFPIENGDFP